MCGNLLIKKHLKQIGCLSARFDNALANELKHETKRAKRVRGKARAKMSAYRTPRIQLAEQRW